MVTSDIARLRSFSHSSAEKFLIHACNIEVIKASIGKEEKSGRMAELAYAIALGAIEETLGGSNPLPPNIPKFIFYVLRQRKSSLRE